MFSDLVTWLVMTKEASDDEQAVIMGQALLESGLIHHGDCYVYCMHSNCCALKQYSNKPCNPTITNFK